MGMLRKRVYIMILSMLAVGCAAGFRAAAKDAGTEGITGTVNGSGELLTYSGGVYVSNTEFESGYSEVDGYRVTNGRITVSFSFDTDDLDVVEGYYFWADTPEVRQPVQLDAGGGSFVIDSEGKGEVRLICIDASGEVMTAGESGLWIERTAPEVDLGEEQDTILLVPPATLKIRADDGEDGSGVAFISYRLDDEEPVEVPGAESELRFGENGEHIIMVTAVDMAGNEGTVTKRLSVNVAPVVTVTLPTDVEVWIVPSTSESGINIFSADWEVINKSNVPVKVMVADYSTNIDYAGDYEGSYLNLKLKRQSVEERFPVGFTHRSNVCDFLLDKADFSKENQYLSSGADARASMAYEGYVGDRFSDYLQRNMAVLHMTFMFEPVMEEPEEVEEVEEPSVSQNMIGGLEP